jgi:hypothetical protein
VGVSWFSKYVAIVATANFKNPRPLPPVGVRKEKKKKKKRNKGPAGAGTAGAADTSSFVPTSTFSMIAGQIGCQKKTTRDDWCKWYLVVARERERGQTGQKDRKDDNNQKEKKERKGDREKYVPVLSAAGFCCRELTFWSFSL